MSIRYATIATVTTTLQLILGVMLMSDLSVSAGSPTEARIAQGPIQARVYLPDAHEGFYRGTRFDWSGVIADLEFAGHNYYPPWFQRMESNIRDFEYVGSDIVAGPCTAITGPAEEFAQIGFDQAEPGETFIKIGVGVLRKPDAAAYSPYRLYSIADGGKWTVTQRPDAIEFRQELAELTTGFGYVYRKTVSLAGDKPQMVLDHSLRNTGRRVIETSVYNHNFLYLDRRAPSPDFLIKVPFKIQTSQPPANGLVEIRDNQITFTRMFNGQDRVYLDLRGFGGQAKDYDIRIENRGLGAGLRITSDRPLSRLALWAIRAPLSIEPFIHVRIEPGADFTWRLIYDYYTL